MAELTKTSIEKLTVPKGKFDAYLWDPALPSFGVRKVHTGSTSFVVKFTIAGRQRKQSLGKLVTNGTAAEEIAKAVRSARNTAQTALAMARLSGDFQAEDRAKKVAIAAQAKIDAADRARLADTIGPRIEKYLDERRHDMRPRSLIEVRRHLTKHLSGMHDLPVTDLRRDIIATEITRIARDCGPVAADRVRASLSAFCSWLIEGQVIEANPCVGIKRKSTGGGRERVLSLEELVVVWHATNGNSDYDRIVRLLMLTGQRRKEIGGLSWDEIDLGRRQVALPANRTKNKRAHIFPLADQALTILQSVSIRDGRSHLFGTGAGSFSGWSKSKERLDGRLGDQLAPWRLHDLRRSFASHCADLDFGSVLAIEAALNHLSGERGGIRGVYNRGQQERQKRELLDKWGAHIAELVTPPAITTADDERSLGPAPVSGAEQRLAS